MTVRINYRNFFLKEGGQKRERETEGERAKRANYTLEEDVVALLIFVFTGNLSLFKSK